MTQDPVRIAMWSGPRNISTAMMRSFENRADAVVWDEPFYAHYLAETGLDHAMADEIIAAYENDWQKVAGKSIGPVPGGMAVFYQKHMTHHLLPHMAMDWLDGLTNAFLIRDPARVLASYIEKRAQVTLEDLGLPQQQRLFEWAHQRTGEIPLVLESDDVLANPEGMLRALCRRTGIAFDPAMLTWPAGRRDSDGLWAAHWYGAVEKSTGFVASRRAANPVPDHLQEVLASAQPYYDALRPYRLAPD